MCVITLKRRELEKLGEKESIAKLIERCGTKLEGGQTDVEKAMKLRGGTAKDAGFYSYCLGNWRFSVVEVSESPEPTSTSTTTKLTYFRSAQVATMLGSGGEPRHVFAALRRLERMGEMEVSLDSGVGGNAHYCSLNRKGVEFFSHKGMEMETEMEIKMEALVEKLAARMHRQESVCVEKVEEIWKTCYKLHQVLNDKKKEGEEEEGEEEEGEEEEEEEEIFKETKRKIRNDTFNKISADYFSEASKESENDDGNSSTIPLVSNKVRKRDMNKLVSDISMLLRDSRLTIPRGADTVRVGLKKFEDYSAKVCAGVLHGIGSPRMDPSAWWDHSLWGRWRDWDFRDVLKVAEEVTQGNL